MQFNAVCYDLHVLIVPFPPVPLTIFRKFLGGKHCYLLMGYANSLNNVGHKNPLLLPQIERGNLTFIKTKEVNDFVRL